MAAPITHIVLTSKVFDRWFKRRVRRDFYVGTSFPDIRYTGVVDRSKTHFEGLTMKDLKNGDSFSAGVRFHSVLDEVREKFMVEKGVYAHCPDSKYTVRALKLLEDELYYDRINNWSEVAGYFSRVLPGERKFGIAEAELQKWHLVLGRYFQNRPNPQSIRDFVLGIGLSEKVSTGVNGVIEVLRTNRKVVKIVEDFYNNFESMIG